MTDKEEQFCDPDGKCRGLGIHYHCTDCGAPGGMYVHIHNGVRTCTGRRLWGVD